MSRKKKPEIPVVRRRPMAPFIAVALLVAAATVWWLWPAKDPAPAPATAPVATASPKPSADASRVVGRWQRPDGGYILEISGWQPGGKLGVSYFNPRPINIGQAAWTQTGDTLNVFVELRDTGYPGATYALRFDAGRDQLLGTYYQPAAAQTFDVEFVRMPAGP